jgi:hypothetical protein
LTGTQLSEGTGRVFRRAMIMSLVAAGPHARWRAKN